MTAEETAIPGLLLLGMRRFADERGFFRELSRVEQLRQLGIVAPLVQTNHSRSRRGVLRGMHYQLRRPQGKLVQVIRGRLFDAVADIRPDSPAFGKVVTVELDGSEDRALWVPAGCAHGFLTLSDEVDLLYRCSDVYVPDDQHGIRWDDPALAIPWPTETGPPALSPRDCEWPGLADAALVVSEDSTP